MRPQARKIALVGTSCTGKTTLVDTFDGCPGVVIAREAAREYFSKHLVPPEIRLSLKVQKAIQDVAIKNERMAALRDSTLILCDRSVIDSVIYTAIGGDYLGADTLYRRAEPYLPTYQRFVVLDPEAVPYEQDEVRAEDESIRREIHEMFLRLLIERGLPFDLLSGTREDYASQIRRWIEE